MATTTFTACMDSELKAELEKIAHFEERTVSYVANKALQSFVAERKATRELVETGLAMIECGAGGIAPESVHDWFMADDEQPFPQAQRVITGAAAAI